MNTLRKYLKSLGYSEFHPLEIQTPQLRLMEVALNDGQPLIAMGTRTGAGVNEKKISVSSLPESIRFVVLDNEFGAIYKRNDGIFLYRSFWIPKQNGVEWGHHARKDLIPLTDISAAIKFGKEKSKTRKELQQLAHLLSFKILDELESGKIRFQFSSSDSDQIQSQLNDIAIQFGLGKDWAEISKALNASLIEVLSRWQQYRFSSALQESGIFTHLMEIMEKPSRTVLPVPKKIIELVHGLLSGCGEPIGIIGEGACGFLDIPMIYAKQAKRICHYCPSIIKMLAQKLLPGFEFIETDFLKYKSPGEWPTLIVIPPFGRRNTSPADLKKAGIEHLTKENKLTSATYEFLWLVKCHQLLKEGGKMVVLIPEGFLNNASMAYARKWVMANFKIEAIISLPKSFFKKTTSIKSSLIVVQKLNRPPQTYQTFLAELDGMANDSYRELFKAYRETVSKGSACSKTRLLVTT